MHVEASTFLFKTIGVPADLTSPSSLLLNAAAQHENGDNSPLNSRISSIDRWHDGNKQSQLDPVGSHLSDATVGTLSRPADTLTFEELNCLRK